MIDCGQEHPGVLRNGLIASQSERHVYFLGDLSMMRDMCTINFCAQIARNGLTVCLRMPW